MVTLKEIKALVEKDYPEIVIQKEIWNLVKGGHHLHKLLKKYPHLGFSIEYVTITHKDGNEKRLGYINVGETFSPTILRNMDGNLIVDSVGGFCERLPGCWTVN